MKKMNKLLSLTALCVLSGPAIAADGNDFYGSIGGGVYHLETGGFDEHAATTRILGGYDFNRYAAVEGSFTRLFSASDTVEGMDVDVDGNVWDLATRFSYPIGERFTPYARMGWSYMDLNAKATDGVTTARANEYDDAFSWGIGTRVRITDRIAVNGEVVRTNIEGGDLDFLSFDVNYRFGSM